MRRTRWSRWAALLLAAGCEFPRPANIDSGYTLTVAKVGDGAAQGVVTSAPGGIECGAACVAMFAEPTAVTLAATAGAGATFVGWSGEGCAGTEPCVVTVDGMRTVTAEFGARVRLTVARDGAGDGTVTGPGIDCGVDCTEDVAVGAMVELTAAPAAGQRFFGWSGACAGTGTCAVTVAAATTVTATFDECVRGAATCAVGTGLYTACGADGAYVSHAIPNGGPGGTPTTIVMRDYACPLGCHASEPRCLDVSASNGLNAALDAAATGPGGMDLAIAEAGETILDTGVYDAVNHTTQLTPPSGTAITVPATVITQSGAPEILVLEVRTLTIAAGATVVVRGPRALGVASHFDVYIAGHLKASGAVGGAGQSLHTGYLAAQSGAATGGGGNAQNGGPSNTAAAGGVGSITRQLVPLEGGAMGGQISPTVSGAPAQEPGGGAVQFVSRTTIGIAGTGIVNVSGAAGYAAPDTLDVTAFAVGGSSGGGVLIEAPTTRIVAGGVINGRGGSGAAANRTTRVTADGRNGDDPSNAGATCTNCGVGGNGGTETMPPQNATGSGAQIGSGGGALGKCVVRNRSGAFAVPAGAMRVYLFPPSVIGQR